MPAASALRHVRIARPRLAVRGLVAYLLDLDARYRARVGLERIDDRMLRDIGVSRADVDAEVARPLI